MVVIASNHASLSRPVSSGIFVRPRQQHPPCPGCFLWARCPSLNASPKATASQTAPESPKRVNVLSDPDVPVTVCLFYFLITSNPPTGRKIAASTPTDSRSVKNGNNTS